jgi:hypothetical protein
LACILSGASTCLARIQRPAAVTIFCFSCRRSFRRRRLARPPVRVLRRALPIEAGMSSSQRDEMLIDESAISLCSRAERNVNTFRSARLIKNVPPIYKHYAANAAYQTRLRSVRIIVDCNYATRLHGHTGIRRTVSAASARRWA